MEYLIKFFSYWVLFTIIYFSFMLIWGWFTTFFYFVTDSSYLTMWSYCDYGFDCLYETMFRDGIRYSFFVSLVVAIFWVLKQSLFLMQVVRVSFTNLSKPINNLHYFFIWKHISFKSSSSAFFQYLNCLI